MIFTPITKEIPDTAYLMYLAANIIFDNKINDNPKTPLATPIPIILPIPNRIKK